MAVPFVASAIKKNLIVGGTSGYGLSIARHLNLLGQCVMVAGQTKRDGKSVLSSISDPADATQRLGYLNFDLRDKDAVKDAETSFRVENDYLDRLIISAAIPQGSPRSLIEYTDTEFKNVIEVNFLAQFHCFQIFSDLLQGSPNGSEVYFFTSTAGWNTTQGFGAYNISKSCLNALIVNLGEDQWTKANNIKIFGIDPWEARTGMNQHSSIHSDHIIPLFDCIAKLKDFLPSGTIFSPDGWTKEFIGHPRQRFNLFELCNHHGITVENYERIKYELAR